MFDSIGGAFSFFGGGHREEGQVGMVGSRYIRFIRYGIP